MRIFAYLIYPSILFGIFLSLYFTNARLRAILKDNLSFILGSVFLAFVFGNAFIYLFLRAERFIYFWDYSTYWESSLLLNQSLKTNALEALKSVYMSMNQDEYTLLPSLLVSLPTSLLGTSFLSFVLSIFNSVVLPLILSTQVLLYLLAEKFSLTLKNPMKLLFSVISVCFIPWYYTLITGYIGVIGQLFIVIIFVIILSKDLLDLKPQDILIINLLNFLLVFCRRWYLFWVISFYVASGLVYIFSEYRKGKSRDLFKRFWTIIQMGLGLFLVTLVFFRPYLFRLFENTYSDQYAAYQDGSNFDFLIKIFRLYGTLVLAPLVYGLYQFIKSKTLDNFIMMILLQSIIVCGLFLQIQGFDWHHFNLINTQILILSSIGLMLFLKTRKYPIYIFSALLVLNLFYVFTLRLPAIEIVSNLIFANVNRVPRVRTDIEEIQDLANYLNDLTSDGQYAYVAASSQTINDDLLRNAQLPWIINSVPHLDATSNIDKRDGFPKDFFNIKYIVTTEPTQYYMRNHDDQFILKLINESIQYEPLFEDNFIVIYDRTISEVRVRIHERINEYSSEEKLYFLNKLKQKYPNDPNLYDYINQ